MALVGRLPVDLGPVDVVSREMMFWMYCPISRPNSLDVHLPPTLLPFEPIVDMVGTYLGGARFYDSWVYLTAKTLWADGDQVGNRPGWHCDGFGTDDLNFIWYDRAPTQFLSTPSLVEVSDECELSMREMTYLVEFHPLRVVAEYPSRHLLVLDKTMCHRSPIDVEPGMRTFVKVSVSRDEYDLEYNSINPILGDVFKHKRERGESRNHPQEVA